MLASGVLENNDAVYGLHLSVKHPIGTVAGRSGPMLVGSGFFEAVISGKGGHATIQQHTVDPIIAASNVIISLRHLVSREADVLDSQVYHSMNLGFIVHFGKLMAPISVKMYSLSMPLIKQTICPLENQL
ncbi:IAA-amino acid hydrolase ILR1-like 1 [Euphorbia peplus]|nr:IAA-amino acid hydrolase ILR1-like 1 [Euphorbia peplus]